MFPYFELPTQILCQQTNSLATTAISYLANGDSISLVFLLFPVLKPCITMGGLDSRMPQAINQLITRLVFGLYLLYKRFILVRDTNLIGML